MSPAEPEITLALPAYNEEANLPAVLRASRDSLDGIGRPWEILVVDNFSSDSTPDLVREFARTEEPRVRLIRHDRNRLYSGSCATALREARGRYVAIMDSDGQFVASDLPRFVEKLEAGANLVFGWRRVRRDPLGRLLMSTVFNVLGKAWLRFPFHDLNVGLRMFDRRFIDRAEIRHGINMSNPELYVRARLASLELAEVEVEHHERAGGVTSHDLRRVFRIFLTVNRYFRSLRLEMSRAGVRRAGAR